MTSDRTSRKRPAWLIDELAYAGRENLDAGRVARYDEKEDADAASEVDLLKDLGLTPGDLILEMKRVLPAPPSVVFGAFSESSELARWWGPEGFTSPSMEFDPRVGGTYRIEMQPPEGDAFYLTGEFREVDPPARLAYTFEWEDPDPDDVETLVGLSFRDLGGSTEVALTQGPFETEARRALHRDGWTDSFDKLTHLMSSRA